MAFPLNSSSNGDCCFQSFFFLTWTLARQASCCVFRSCSERCASSRWEMQSGVKIKGQGMTTASRWVKTCNLWVVPRSLPVSGGFQGSGQVFHCWATIYLECKQSSQVRVGMYSLTENYWLSVRVNRNLFASVFLIVLAFFSKIKTDKPD